MTAHAARCQLPGAVKLMCFSTGPVFLRAPSHERPPQQMAPPHEQHRAGKVWIPCACFTLQHTAALAVPLH
eukprot:359401-Chlamydomonas_euryale.AAC.3